MEKSVMASGLVFETGAEEFDEKVLQASKARPVMVDFWADWCPPCITLTPVLERVVAAYGGAFTLAKVEVDAGENMRLAGRYGLRGFPTVILFVGGEEAGRFHGAKPDHWVKDFVDEHSRG